jgi:hypothetical protein
MTGLLRIVRLLMEAGASKGLSAGVVHDLLALVCLCIEQASPLQIFLDDLKDALPVYRESRRIDVLARSGGAE